MKKFGKILVLVLSLALALGAFVFTVSANDAPFLVEGLYRNNWAEAIDNAGDGVPVKLLSDYNVSEGESVEITKSVTIDLDGYKIISKNADPLFVIGGKDVELTIIGPGTINVAGTFVKVDGEGASLVVSGGESGISIETTAEATVFEVGGSYKSKMSVEGVVNVKAKAKTTFASLKSASSLDFNNAKVAFTGSSDASSPVTLIGANCKVDVVRSDIYTEIGTMFEVLGPTDIGSPAVVKAEYSTLTANSGTWGTIIDAADEYLTATMRISTVRASGKAFVAADTMKEVASGEGESKVYKAPKSSVYLTNSTYGLPSAVQEVACLYYGNITGVVSGGIIEISKNVLAVNTRLWDGENGILVKVGTKASGSMSDEAQTKKLIAILTSEISESGKDSDGTVIYFNPSSTTNKNFSFEDINGESTGFYSETKINAEHNAETYLILGIPPENSYFIDSDWSTNFQSHALVYRHSNGTGTPPDSPTANGIGTRYGAVAIVDSADGTNRYYKFEYKQDEYIAGKYGMTAASYMGVFIGMGTRTGEKTDPTIDADFITIDIDVSSDVEVDGRAEYMYSGISIIQRPGTSDQYQTHGNLMISGNKFYGGYDAAGKSVSRELPKNVGEWAHLTFLLKIDNSTVVDADGNIKSYNLSNSVLYTYYNGEFVGTTKLLKPEADKASADTVKNLSLDELRFAFPGVANINANNKDASLCLDNVVVTHYKKGYEGDIQKLVADTSLRLNDASDVVFGDDYQFPTPNVNNAPLMIVDDVKYYDVNAGLAAISEGSVVELYGDVPGTYNAKVGFTVYKNGNKFDVASATHYIAPLYGEIDAYKISKSNNYVPVYWDVDDYANRDKEESIYAELNVPFGMTPAYVNSIPAGSEVNGLWREFIGWSYTKGATEPEELRPITKADVDRGYVCIYPVYGYTKAKITFLGIDNKPLGDAVWVEIGTSINELVKLNDGSTFPTYEIEGNTWYKLGFSGWALKDSAETVVGVKAYEAVPKFERPIITAIKQGFSLIRLTRFVATVYIESDEGVAGVDIIGVYSDSACTNALETTEKVFKGSNIKYIAANMSANMLGFRVDQLEEASCYVKYSVGGIEYTQKVSAKFDAYLETLITREGATDDEKAVALEMMRFVNKSFEVLGLEGSEVCDKYLENTNYASQLRDLTTVSSLFSDVEKDATQYAQTSEEIKGLEYDYSTNTIYFIPHNQFLPIVGGWASPGAYMLNVNINGGGNKTRLQVGVTSPTGKFTGPLNDDSYPANPKYEATVPYLVFNIDSYLNATFYDFYDGANRKSLGTGKYRWANYITFLEADPDADPLELEYARIIYSMHYSIKEATGLLNNAPPVE